MKRGSFYLALLLITFVVHSHSHEDMNDNCTDPKCAACQSIDTCDQCQPDYYEVQTDNQCKLCADAINYCSICNQPTVSDPIICTQCNLDYFKRNNTCITCSTAIPNCLSCRQSPTATITCTQCNAHSTLINNTCKLCIQLIDYCTECTAAVNNTKYVVCTKCQEQFPEENVCPFCADEHCTNCMIFQNNGTISCRLCERGFYLSKARCETCSNRILNCTSCTMRKDTTTLTCNQCAEGFYLTNNTCIGCGISHCYSCLQLPDTNSTICSLCDDNYYRTANYTCMGCAEVIPDCITCSSTFTTINVYCLNCIRGKFYNYETKQCLDTVKPGPNRVIVIIFLVFGATVLIGAGYYIVKCCRRNKRERERRQESASNTSRIAPTRERQSLIESLASSEQE